LYFLVRDNGSPILSTTITVAIVVDGVNEYPPVMTSPASVLSPSVAEDTSTGYVVTTLTATDQDAGNDGKVHLRSDNLLVGCVYSVFMNLITFLSRKCSLQHEMHLSGTMHKIQNTRGGIVLRTNTSS
jgi:hypothetical protein